MLYRGISIVTEIINNSIVYNGTDKNAKTVVCGALCLADDKEIQRDIKNVINKYYSLR